MPMPHSTCAIPALTTRLDHANIAQRGIHLDDTVGAKLLPLVTTPRKPLSIAVFCESAIVSGVVETVSVAFDSRKRSRPGDP
jgi:hypothetical protein